MYNVYSYYIIVFYSITLCLTPVTPHPAPSTNKCCVPFFAKYSTRSVLITQGEACARLLYLIYRQLKRKLVEIITLALFTHTAKHSLKFEIIVLCQIKILFAITNFIVLNILIIIHQFVLQFVLQACKNQNNEPTFNL